VWSGFFWLRIRTNADKSGRPRHRYENTNKMDLKEIGPEAMDWTYLPQDREKWRALVNAVMNIRVP
jgi:hypothetical protein